MEDQRVTKFRVLTAQILVRIILLSIHPGYRQSTLSSGEYGSQGLPPQDGG